MAKNDNETREEPLEKQLWKAADKLRKNIDAAEYKHIVLGLIFLKYISDAFEGLYQRLQKGEGDYASADPEDRDEYKAENVFFVPAISRWSYIQARAKQPEIGKDVDNAMDAIEKENPSLKGVLPKWNGSAHRAHLLISQSRRSNLHDRALPHLFHIQIS
jgi:type I restriction enzyme M protein